MRWAWDCRRRRPVRRGRPVWGRCRARRGAGGLGRWLSGFGWRWHRRVWSLVGLRGERSEVGVAPDGFELLFVLGRGAAVGHEEIPGITLSPEIGRASCRERV